MVISDQELAAGLQQGSSALYEELVKRYNNRIYQYLYRLLRDQAEAQDVVQETFLRVYQHRSDYDPQYSLKTWIYSIATRLAINILNSARRKRLFFLFRREEESSDFACPQLEELPDPKATPEEHYSNQQRYEQVITALNHLQPRQRTALILNKLEGLSYKEIADTIGVSLSTVESLIFRAKQKLRHELGEKK